MQSVASPLIRLNNDVKGLIFALLDARSLNRLRTSCKHLKDVVDKSAEAWKRAFLQDFPNYPLPQQANWQKLYRDHSLLVKRNKRPKEHRCEFKNYDRTFLPRFVKEKGIEEFTKTPAPIYQFSEEPKSIIHSDFWYLINPIFSIEKRELISNHLVHTFKPTRPPIECVYLKNNRLVVLCQSSGDPSITIWNTKNYQKLREINYSSRPSQQTLPFLVFSHTLYITFLFKLKNTQAVKTDYYDLETGENIGQRTSEVVDNKKFVHIIKDGFIFEGIEGEKWTLIDLRSHEHKPSKIKTWVALPKLLFSKIIG